MEIVLASLTVVKSDDENNFILQSLNLLYKYCIQLKILLYSSIQIIF